MINTSLRDQLQTSIKNKKLHPKYFDGYAKWAKKFNDCYVQTKDVTKALDMIYGKYGSIKRPTKNG